MALPLLIVEQDDSGTIRPEPIPPDFESSTVNKSAPSAAPHICIVGAGIAGLKCAEILLTHGIKVTILEARNRIGGRVLSRIRSPVETPLS